MDVDRKPVPFAGFVNRPVIPVPEGDAVGGRKEADGRDLRRASQSFDFPHGGPGILEGNLDSQQEAFVRRQPVMDVEIVKSPANCIHIIRIWNPGNRSLTPRKQGEAVSIPVQQGGNEIVWIAERLCVQVKTVASVLPADSRTEPPEAKASDFRAVGLVKVFDELILRGVVLMNVAVDDRIGFHAAKLPHPSRVRLPARDTIFCRFVISTPLAVKRAKLRGRNPLVLTKDAAKMGVGLEPGG